MPSDIYLNKQVAIVGYGVEGKSAAAYFKDRGAQITIFDERAEIKAEAPADAEVRIGREHFASLDGFDLVSRSPSVRPDEIKTDGTVTSVTKEFFAHCPARIVGVTGTKGKGTTSSLISLILEDAGHTVHLVGNIGKPALDVLGNVQPDDIVVYELSSFQLWDMDQSPHVAVVLMIETDHQDVHISMDEYVAAKTNITAYQGSQDTVIYHPKNRYSLAIANHGKGSKKRYLTDDAAWVNQNHEFEIFGKIICSKTDVGLIGEHNLENVAAALSAAGEFTQDIEAMAKATKSFKGLEHRLEVVTEKDGVTYVNDSISTSVSAAVAALKCFMQPKVIILGGSSKGQAMQPLIDELKQSSMRQVVLMGDTGKQLQKLLAEQHYTSAPIASADSMKTAVDTAKKAAQKGDVVLLSPGSASFGLFKDYKDRGAQFKQLVGAP